jgi:hypothetical protein
LKTGYYNGRQISLQTIEERDLDISVQTALKSSSPKTQLNYNLAAVEVLAAPSTVLNGEWVLDALQIRELESGNLVTIVEIISPGYKTKPETITAYKLRRERLVVDEGVNIVEIDLTRSVK